MGTAPYLLSLDSDVLFFTRPAELLDAARDVLTYAVFNRDLGSSYCIPVEVSKRRWGLEPVACINAGLGVWPRRAFPLEAIEEFLAAPELATGGLTEQTVHALFAARHGVRFLSDRYAVTRGPGLVTPAGEPLVARHYPAYTRHLLFEEGIPHLRRHGFLRALGAA
jgi:hypothetical protein